MTIERIVLISIKDPGFVTRDSGLGIRDSGFGTRDSGWFGIRDSGSGIRDQGSVLSKLAVIGIERAVFCWDIPWLSRSGHDDTSGMLSELRPR
jgi:hypothetical protein